MKKIHTIEFRKVAVRGNYPKFDDPDTFLVDPNSRPQPGDGRGMKMTTPGDEKGWGGGVGRARRPANISSDPEMSNRDDPKNVVPSETHWLAEDSRRQQAADGDGEVNVFEDETFSPFVTDKYDKTPDPIGPHNMHKSPNQTVYQGVRNRVN